MMHWFGFFVNNISIIGPIILTIKQANCPHFLPYSELQMIGNKRLAYKIYFAKVLLLSMSITGTSRPIMIPEANYFQDLPSNCTLYASLGNMRHLNITYRVCAKVHFYSL